MIEVTIWFGDGDGDGAEKFIVDVEPSNHGFDTGAYASAVRRAMIEFEFKGHTKAAMYKIDARQLKPRQAILSV